jgi:hypothetical protein
MLGQFNCSNYSGKTLWLIYLTVKHLKKDSFIRK